MNHQKGFTLVELVIVIVILGILAATAIPRFVNLNADAGNAAAQGIAGAVSSSSAINYATSRLPGKTAGTDFQAIISGTTTCLAAVNALVQPNIDSTKFTVSAGEVTGTAGAVSTNCTIRSAETGATVYNLAIIPTS